MQKISSNLAKNRCTPSAMFCSKKTLPPQSLERRQLTSLHRKLLLFSNEPTHSHANVNMWTCTKKPAVSSFSLVALWETDTFLHNLRKIHFDKSSHSANFGAHQQITTLWIRPKHGHKLALRGFSASRRCTCLCSHRNESFRVGKIEQPVLYNSYNGNTATHCGVTTSASLIQDNY